MKFNLDQFPITVQVTQEMIDGADVKDIFNCIGARMMSSLFPDYKWGESKKFSEYEGWGINTGWMVSGDNLVKFESRQKDQKSAAIMTRIKEPQEVIIYAKIVK